jgi:hypothetical protein
MPDDKIFPVGIFAKPPHENAPDFVKAKVSVKVEDFIGWAKAVGEEWINMDIKISQGGKMYMEVDTWKPSKSATGGSSPAKPAEPKPDFDDEIPW